MTKKCEQLINNEIKRQVKKLAAYAKGDNKLVDEKPTAESIKAAVEQAKYFVLGYCKALIDLGLMEDDEIFGVFPRFTSRVFFNPFTGEYTFDTK